MKTKKELLENFSSMLNNVSFRGSIEHDRKMRNKYQTKESYDAAKKKIKERINKIRAEVRKEMIEDGILM